MANHNIMRQNVWKTYIGAYVAQTKCMCCGLNDIDVWTFENGHVLSRSGGGLSSIENLRPICRTCNASMGVMNMDDFMKMHGFIRSPNWNGNNPTMIDDLIILNENILNPHKDDKPTLFDEVSTLQNTFGNIFTFDSSKEEKKVRVDGNTIKNSYGQEKYITVEKDDYRVDRILFEEIRKWRVDTSKSESKKPYEIFTDVTLASLACWKPKDEEALAKIYGLGKTKIKKYGNDLLKIINK
jgi:HRDC domain/HNH endonuclease